MRGLAGTAALFRSTGLAPLATGLSGYAVFEAIDYLRHRGVRADSVTAAPAWVRYPVYGAFAGAALIGLLLFTARTSGTTNFIYAIF